MSFDVSVSRALSDRTISATFSGNCGITALFGPSGAGKTSILNMVAGLLRPDEGHIRLGNLTFFDHAMKIDIPTQRRRAGYIFQEGRLFPHRNVRNNLLYGWQSAQPEEHIMTQDEVKDFLGIGHLLDRWPHTLSGGEAQRVAIGRALLSAPKFLLMDEPLASLDSERREEIMVVIERLRDELRLPILYVTHDKAEVERLASAIISIA